MIRHGCNLLYEFCYIPIIHVFSDLDRFVHLLDNAQEACLQSDDPVIVLKSIFREPYLTISCRNTVKNEPEDGKKRRIPELEQGVGFTILNDLARRYDGSFLTEQEDGWFKTEIILKNEEKNAC